VTYRRLAPGIAALIAAAALAVLVPTLFGTPRPRVFVTWRNLADTDRVRLERRLALSEATALGNGAWSYVPLDTSRDTLRALVRLDSVASTDGIDRTAFRISDRGPLTARRGGLIPGAPPIAARAVKFASYALAGIGALLLVRAGFSKSGRSAQALGTDVRTRFSDPRAVGLALATWLTRGVPLVSPGSMAAFRILFGVLVTASVWFEPVYPALLDAYDVGSAGGLYGTVVRAIADRPWILEALRLGVLAFGMAFVAGLRPRLSFAALTACVLVWACVLTLRTTSHMVSALVLTMVSLLPARWGAGWGVDSVLGRKRATNTSEVVSGFPLWVPVLVLGVTFAAAAWAKMQNGLAWILNGTVKYHFISDMEHAWVDWGVRMTESHAVAVVLSAGAVLVEAAVITAAFSRSDRYRLAMGLAALALLAGFALFQGVVWPAWWVLLIGFLPWRRIAPARAPLGTVPVRLRPAEVLAVLFVIGQQVYVSGQHVEARPLFTAYDMYSTTYANPDDYEAAGNLVYRVVAVSENEAADRPGCVVDDAGAHAVAAAAQGDQRARARVRGLLGSCFAERRGVTMVRLEGDRQVYDWQQRRFHWQRRLDVIGPVRVDWMYE
jgi:hypothetical protein